MFSGTGSVICWDIDSIRVSVFEIWCLFLFCVKFFCSLSANCLEWSVLAVTEIKYSTEYSVSFSANFLLVN